MQVVRDAAGPNIPIGIDSNCGWNVAQARRTLAELREFQILFAEQPVGIHDPEALAEVRRSTDIPVMADESVFTLNDAWRPDEPDRPGWRWAGREPVLARPVVSRALQAFARRRPFLGA